MIYISGQMTGIEDFNYPEFNRVAKDLRSIGMEVFNPAEVKIKKPTYKKYMKADLKGLKKCNVIYLLKGWENSTGAKKELRLALKLGLEVICQE